MCHLSQSVYSDGLWGGRPGFGSWKGKRCFSIPESRQTPQLTQPAIQWAPGALFLGGKRQGRETDHSPPSSAEVMASFLIH
jgi:hypothetical protein